MGKKQYQSQGNYAKKGSQEKKRKRSQNPNVKRSARPVSTEKDITEGTSQPAARSVPAATHTSAPTTTTSHAYVVSDLIRTGIIAGIAFVILVVLYIVL